MTIRDHVALLRAVAWLVLAGAAVGVAIAVVVTVLTPPVYDSSASFYVSARPGAEASDSWSGTRLAEEKVASYSQLLTGPRVAADASRELGGTPSPDAIQDVITVEPVKDTVVLSMRVTAGSADDAVRLATAVAGSFLRLVGTLDTPPGLSSPVVTEMVLPPTVPTEPVSPKLKLNVPVGALLGAVLGYGVGILRRSRDTSVAAPAELEPLVDGPVLGVVPTDATTATRPVVLPSHGTATTRVEAYRHLRSAVDDRRRVLVLTGASAGAGTTTLTLNLAISLAAAGRRVLYVDGDLRSAGGSALLIGTLGLEPGPGLATVVAGDAELRDAIRHWEPGGIDVLTAGHLPARPSELLASRAAPPVLGRLRRRYDHVLVDTPPIPAAVDAASLAAHADGVVLLARAGVTTRPELAQVRTILRAGGIPLVGAVLTRTASARRGTAVGRREPAVL
ncbi:tyrosine-protein kinase domain-containing protein [Actinomycetospora sp. C-140]